MISVISTGGAFKSSVCHRILQQQTHTDWEHIIMDDTQPEGLAIAEGIAKARGEFVTIYRWGTTWHPDRLAKQTIPEAHSASVLKTISHHGYSESLWGSPKGMVIETMIFRRDVKGCLIEKLKCGYLLNILLHSLHIGPVAVVDNPELYTRDST